MEGDTNSYTIDNEDDETNSSPSQLNGTYLKPL